MSLNAKIFAYFGAFCAVMLILLWLFQVVFLDSFYKTIKSFSLSRMTKIVETAAIIDNNYEQKIYKYASKNEACVIIAQTNGTVLFSCDVMPNCAVHHWQLSDYLNAVNMAKSNGGTCTLSVKNRISNIQNNSDGISGLVKVKIFKTKDNIEKVLLVNISITPVDATVTTIMFQLIIVTFIMLLFSLFLAFVISRRISRPIEKMTENAKMLADGNYNIDFSSNDYSEISELGNALNFTEGELKKTDQYQKDLLANISHDMRTPLTMIRGYAEVMRDLPSENTPENIQIIIDEATRLSSLINDALDVSKLKNGQMSLSKAKFDITESIKNILDRYKKLIMEGYDITFEYDANVKVFADELKISQVIYNLINNAITHTGDDKKVIVRQKIEPDGVKIEVSDTGEGINKEDLNLIWERYYKVDKEHKRSPIGSGLGLSIVKSIIMLHKGTCGVRSQKGKGSTFWFKI